MSKLKKELIEILACPKCKAPVIQDADSIKCTSRECGLKYPVKDGIPIMLIDEAEKS